MSKLTATEVAALEQARHNARMNYFMAKALVKGIVSSDVQSHAEMIYESYKDLFEPEEA